MSLIEISEMFTAGVKEGLDKYGWDVDILKEINVTQQKGSFGYVNTRVSVHNEAPWSQTFSVDHTFTKLELELDDRGDMVRVAGVMLVERLGRRMNGFTQAVRT